MWDDVNDVFECGIYSFGLEVDLENNNKINLYVGGVCFGVLERVIFIGL